jgi:hypothetical protein
LVHWFHLSYNRRFQGCEDVLRFEIRLERRGVGPRLRRNLGVIGRVRVDGARATAQVSDQAETPRAYRNVTLRKTDGRWLIDDSDAIPRGQ